MRIKLKTDLWGAEDSKEKLLDAINVIYFVAVIAIAAALYDFYEATAVAMIALTAVFIILNMTFLKYQKKKDDKS